MTFLQQTHYFNKNLKFWLFLGIYPFEINSKLYKFYSKILFFVFIFLYDSLITINFYFLPNDLNMIIDDMVFYFTLLSIIPKVLTYFIMKEDIRDILNFLNGEKFQPKNEKEIQIINAAKKFNEKYWKVVAILSYSCNVILLCTPVIHHLITSVPLEFTINGYFFLSEDFRRDYVYYIYFYQAIGALLNMLYNMNIDSFFLGLLILVIAKIDILGEKLNSITTNISDSDGMINRDIDEICIRKLNDCILHYNNISKFCLLVEKVFSVTLFVQFTVSSCTICVSLYRLTLPSPPSYYLSLGSYLFIIIVQIFVPCYFGARIMDKSSQLSHAVYSCNWTSRSRRFKSSMRLFIERSLRPHSITGGKIFPLSLVTFTSIMNAAYSFFTLLENMQSNET
ncbi:odorant receptor 46a-like [Danaus plexippus]|uniref:odorant receptor 46a-like n=1 Tax=Danaus plexippus TaxID=13037 RepID=UPI002AB0460B|nr:odorant receptor 46a-like [Danaus plexippus]